MKNNNEWVESERKKQEDKKVEGCTFKPQTLNYHSTHVDSAPLIDRN